MTRRAALALAAILSAGGAGADGLDGGAEPYERCALCHGLFGDSPRDRFPHLAGQNPAYIARQIAAFGEGRRTNDGGQMAAVVTELAAADVPVVVDWFASQEPPAAAEPTPEARDGEILFAAAACAECHAETATPGGAMPYLSAQHPAYLAKQMREVRDALRPADAKGEMRAQLRDMSDAQIDAIAAYLAALERPR